MPERTLIAKAIERDSSKEATAMAVSGEPWPLDHSTHRPEELGVSGLCWLGLRKVLCDAAPQPHPRPPYPYQASLTKFCPRNPSVRGRDKEEPEGKPYREERRKQREKTVNH